MKHAMIQNANPPLHDFTPQFNPDSPYLIGLARLLNAAYSDIDLGPIGNTLIHHLQSAPDDHRAMMDLSSILYIRGNDEVAAAMQLDAVRTQQLYHLPTAASSATQPRLRLLALMVTGDFMANTPLEFMLGDSDIALDVLYVEPYGELPRELPPHDVLFIAVGESDLTRDLLEELCEAVEAWQSPLLNHPRHSLDLSRDRVGKLLQGKPGIAIPLTARAGIHDLQTIQDGDALTGFLPDGEFPLIIRPIGSHAGKGLEKLQTRVDIATYLDAHGGDEFFISRFVDYSSADGLFRKYRIVLVEGRPLLCHMAISENWMVHYLNAGMTGEDGAKRDEEAAVMHSFDTGFAVRHRAAFRVLARTFPLDYFGIDCAETRDGRLLIFEVDTGMIVHAMDPVDLFPYKQDNMRKVFDVFRGMLYRTMDASRASRLSPVSELLLQGGDERIRLLPGEPFNKYGCRPYPVAGCIDFGSSTASHVSARTFSLLEAQQRRLAAALAVSTPEQTYADELQSLRASFLSLWGLQPGAVEMIFCASGTDAHRIAARLVETLYDVPPAIIMIQGEESGSGVAAALRGDSHASRSNDDAPPFFINLRTEDGGARSRSDVDAGFEYVASEALKRGLPAMIVAVDVSKTGIAAPGLGVLARMKKRWGAQLTILVDACQFRMDAATLQGYLQLGCMVAVTGSKFFAAPSFCGALLLPDEPASRLQARQIPAALRGDCASAEWPANWPGAGRLAAAPNMGLLLRWKAAVHEMQRFLQIPVPAVHRIVSACATEIQRRLSDDAHFQALDNRAAGSPAPATIHAFRPCALTPYRKPLGRNEVERLHFSLQHIAQEDGYTYRLGQPAQCGAGDRSWALRLCLSAPMIATAYYAGDAGLAELIAQALACLAAVAASIERL